MSNDVWVHCKNGHEWVAAQTPMEMHAFAEQVKRNGNCPKCGLAGFMGRAPSPTGGTPNDEHEETPPPA